MTGRSIVLFIAAAIAEIGGAYLVWIGIKDHRGLAFIALGAMALTAYGVIAAFQPSQEFGRVLAAYGGVFIVGSLGHTNMLRRVAYTVAFECDEGDRSKLKDDSKAGCSSCGSRPSDHEVIGMPGSWPARSW